MARRAWTRPAVVALAVVGLATGVLAGCAAGDDRPARVAAVALPPAPADRMPASAPRSPLPGGLATGGGRLLRDGHPVIVPGVNAYQAATWWAVNWGCGPPVGDLARLFAQVPPGGVVRFWAFQAQGWNDKVTPGRIDLTGIDRVVAAADAAHRQLVLTLSDQSGTCDDGHWHDQAWYDGGHAGPRADDDGRHLGSQSYDDWVRLLVTRYRNDPAVAVWEPVNEPEASDCTGATGRGCFDPAHRRCPPGAAASLARFFTRVGGLIHALDPHHLVSEGVQGGGQCGLAGDDYRTVGASPGVDVLTYHDYGAEDDPLPDGLLGRLGQARALGKPLLVEEAGVSGGSACRPLAARAQVVRAKASTAVLAGAAGWLPWWYDESGPGSCNQDLGPGDPALTALGDALGPLTGVEPAGALPGLRW